MFNLGKKKKWTENMPTTTTSFTHSKIWITNYFILCEVKKKMSQILGDFLNIQGLNWIFVRSLSFNKLIEQTFD